MFTKRKNQSKKYKYKVISPYKNTVCFSLPYEKPLRKPSRKWLRVFTKGFTADNVKIFYDKLTSSGMVVLVLELDRRQGSSSPWGTCNGKHLMGEGGTGTEEPNVWTVIPLKVSLS